MTGFALTAGALFDGEQVHRPGACVVHDGKITAVTHPSALPVELPVTDYGSGIALMPGLIDSHTHLAFDAGDDASHSSRTSPDEVLLKGMRAAAGSTLTAGVTTVRDLGDRGYLTTGLRSEFVREPRNGPDIHCAGPPITTPGGHCWFLGGETGPSDDELRHAVREHAAHHVDVVKIMVDGGTLSQNGSNGLTQQFAAAQLATLVTAAHRHGLPVAVHAHTPESIAAAVRAGADTVEHGSFLTAHGKQPDHDILDAAARQRVAFSATAGFDEMQLTARTSTIATTVRTGLGELRAAGVPVVIGTDAGLGPAKPHGVLPQATRDLAAAGYAADEVLTILTSAAARVCGVADRKGHLAAGADADILAVSHETLVRPSTLAAGPTAVYRRGLLV